MEKKFIIEWGDGTKTQYVGELPTNLEHEYNDDAVYTITVKSDYEINQEESTVRQVVNVTLGEGITIIDGEKDIYCVGDTLTIEATVPDEYMFEKWSDGNKTNPRTIVLDGDINLEFTYVEIPKINYLYIQSLEDNNTVTIQSPYTTASLQTSTNGTTWVGADEVSTVTINSGDKLYFKGTNVKNGTSNTYPLIDTSGTFNLGGNIATLTDGLGDDTTVVEYQYHNFFLNTKVVDASNLVLPATTLVDWCYSRMFYGCTSLTSAPTLPATNLTDYCYSNMFNGCTSLTTVPELPATTLASSCYSSMFSGCTSLTSAPALPATTLKSSCYSSMFRGCTSLTSAPELPATTLVRNCYYSMFQGCTRLTTAPALPATTLASECYYYMFRGCTSLTTVPELPATTLVDWCYSYMFSGCRGLTTAPALPATTLADYCYYNMFSGCRGLTTAPTLPATTLAYYCYLYMFSDCSNLNYIKALFLTTPSTSYTNNWVNGVARTGTFVKNADATWDVTGNNGIPSGWTIETATEQNGI